MLELVRTKSETINKLKKKTRKESLESQLRLLFTMYSFRVNPLKAIVVQSEPSGIRVQDHLEEWRKELIPLTSPISEAFGKEADYFHTTTF